MTYTELINASQDALRVPELNRVDAVATLVACYCLAKDLDVRDFDFETFFLILEAV